MVTKAKAAETKIAKKEYTSEDIKQLPFPLCVQQRSGMYIGNNDHTGILVCIREILNNSVDEFLAGFATHIKVIRVNINSFIIVDNGRGIPFDKHESGKNALEVIFGELHAGRNFEKKTVYSTGINGVGGSCVNALSSVFQVVSIRKDKKGTITFNNGYVKEEPKVFSKAKPFDNKDFKESSSMVSFVLNEEFFEKDAVLAEDDLVNLINETAYLNSGLKITYENITDKTSKVYQYDNGVYNLLHDRIEKKIIPVIGFESEVIEDTKIEIAFTYTDSFKSDNIQSFCNTIHTADGGTHVTGFKRSLSAKLLNHIKEKGLTKEKIEHDDIYAGLEAIVSVFVFNPKYTTQTKTKLANTDVSGHVLAYANKVLGEWLDSDPKEIKIITKKIELTAKSRIAQKRALESVKKDSNSILSSLSSIEKFADCEEQMSGRTELFIVEGKNRAALVKLP